MTRNNRVYTGEEDLRVARRQGNQDAENVADAKCNLQTTLPAHFRRSSVIIGGLSVPRERENILFRAVRPIPSR